jgi:hypothetical protein
MECLKCKGLMVTDRIPSFLSETASWRCINCGLVLDPLISENQDAMASLLGRRPAHLSPRPVRSEHIVRLRRLMRDLF